MSSSDQPDEGIHHLPPAGALNATAAARVQDLVRNRSATTPRLLAVDHTADPAPSGGADPREHPGVGTGGRHATVELPPQLTNHGDPLPQGVRMALQGHNHGS